LINFIQLKTLPEYRKPVTTMEKLIQIQAELKAPKNQMNKFGNYKYRSCEDILEAVKPLLQKYGCSLIITDEIKEIGGIIYVEACASLNDGKFTTSVTASAGIEPNKKGMDIAQSFGASSSYARKYALNGLFLIDDTKDADATNTHGKHTETDANSKVGIDADLLLAINDCKSMEELTKLYNKQSNLSQSEKQLFSNAKIKLNEQN